ncbi:MAG: TetR/AcrR family transcriptional regulator [Halioglobus sp.]|nr:TetR/AcrR family transcriptional regulator [Halioglobus sp.]
MAEKVTSTRETKGERTARRVMDIAEDLFARQGYDGTSLRQIARGAGIKEPGLYNHFASKQALYEAVLYRALNPMAEALSQRMDSAAHLRDYTDLPAVMTDILLEHPQMAALFQQAMQGDAESVGNRLVSKWLERLFDQGMQSLVEFTSGTDLAADELLAKSNEERASLAINLIAMFNLTTGYFLSQRAFESMAQGQLTDPDNIARQKQLLRKVIRAMLIN